MVTVGLNEIPAPAAEWVQTCPESSEKRVVRCLVEVLTALEQVKIDSQTNDMQGIGYPYTNSRVERRRSHVTFQFPTGKLIAQLIRLIDESWQELHKE